ncbi:sigma 54-interacting transcriptional regulator [Thermovenabulum sp.]|uniref:sigma 54-interacting transcriptional regulator n=1 Tax=Thermovenabulum sp. TaxID=3100335 RepID=UPI003C7A0723
MKSKIALISPYPELTNIAKRISVEQGEDIDIYEGVLEEGVEIAKKLSNQKEADVIISRGATGALIRKNIDIPFVSIEITDFDVFLALYEAAPFSNHIGFFGYDYKKGHFDFELFSKILNKKISCFYYKSEKELREKLYESKESGIDMAVGTGACIIEEAQKLGLKGKLVFSSASSVLQAIITAKNIKAVIEKDRGQKELINTLLEHITEGIIALDEERKVIMYNSVSEKLLKAPKKDVLNKKIFDINFNTLQKIYKDSQLAKEEIIEIENKKLLVKRSNINIDSKNIGTVITVQDISKIQEVEQSIRTKLVKKGLIATYRFEDIYGNSKILLETINKAKKYSCTDSTVLILGESGTGKELFAQSIHNESKRADGPFVAINCAALPENLLESELFGYEEGAFTGAKKGGKAGLFELAHGGTLFLDEIGDLSLNLQAQLLRVLQEKKVMRLGGHQLIPVDVRIIAATNIDLKNKIEEGKFRRDLYYRLNILTLTIPPLRERKEDIEVLCINFIKEFNELYGKKISPQLEDKIYKLLLDYHWPGNVRELKNLIEKCVILCEDQKISFSLISSLLNETGLNQKNDSNDGQKIIVNIGTLEEMEKQIFKEIFLKYNNKKEVARVLGVSRTTLWKKLKGI